MSNTQGNYTPIWLTLRQNRDPDIQPEPIDLSSIIRAATCQDVGLGSCVELSHSLRQVSRPTEDAERPLRQLRSLLYSWLNGDSPTRPRLANPAMKLGHSDGAFRCKDPHPYRNGYGQPKIGGCGKCFWCRKEKKVARFKRVKKRIDVRNARGEVPFFVTLNIRAEDVDFVTPRAMSQAASAALQALSRPRQGLRQRLGTRRASAWAGLDFAYLRSPGVNETGVCHYHALIWVQGPSPGCSAIRAELSRLFDSEIKKVLGKLGLVSEQDLDNGRQMASCYLRPCETVLGSARYICLGQESEENPLPVGLRMSYSKGL
jgi:hypothetical protein